MLFTASYIVSNFYNRFSLVCYIHKLSEFFDTIAYMYFINKKTVIRFLFSLKSDFAYINRAPFQNIMMHRRVYSAHDTPIINTNLTANYNLRTHRSLMTNGKLFLHRQSCNDSFSLTSV